MKYLFVKNNIPILPDNPDEHIRGGAFALDDIKGELEFQLGNLSALDGILKIHLDKLVNHMPCLSIENLPNSDKELLRAKLGKENFIEENFN